MNADDIERRSFALLQAADRLAAHNPSEYQAFVVALAGYSEIPNMKLLHADHYTVHNLQGQARMAFELSTMLAECKDNLERMVAARSAKARAKQGKRNP